MMKDDTMKPISSLGYRGLDVRAFDRQVLSMAKRTTPLSRMGPKLRTNTSRLTRRGHAACSRFL